MAKYRAIVSFEFNDEELEDLKNHLGIKHPSSPDEALQGELDNLSFGTSWVEQIFKDGKPIIHRLTKGVMVEISEFEE